MIRDQRQSLVLDCFDKDVMVMASNFRCCTQNNGWMNFGTHRIKSIQVMIHWVQEWLLPHFWEAYNSWIEWTFIQGKIGEGTGQGWIRKTLDGKSSTASKAANPGPLTEKLWKEWEEKFVDYARYQMGTNGIPLSYMIRENDDSDSNGDHPDFVSKMIT